MSTIISTYKKDNRVRIIFLDEDFDSSRKNENLSLLKISTSYLQHTEIPDNLHIEDIVKIYEMKIRTHSSYEGSFALGEDLTEEVRLKWVALATEEALEESGEVSNYTDHLDNYSLQEIMDSLDYQNYCIVTKESLDKTGTQPQDILNNIKAEIELFEDEYCGDVYGYVEYELQESGELKEVGDSCWGYIGTESIKAEIKGWEEIHNPKKVETTVYYI